MILAPNLFQKFIRANGAGEVNITGTGLGLYPVTIRPQGGATGQAWPNRLWKRITAIRQLADGPRVKG